jgi:hypothetical protein
LAFNISHYYVSSFFISEEIIALNWRKGKGKSAKGGERGKLKKISPLRVEMTVGGGNAKIGAG